MGIAAGISLLGIAFSAVFVGAQSAGAQSAGAQQEANPAPPTQEEINRRLLERLDQLEKEVQALRAQSPVAAPAPVTAPLTVPLPAPAAEPAAQEIEVNEVAPRLKLMVFGDVGADIVSHVPSTFGFGSLDLFMTA
ncbi:MAG TPA: hypothetical protein VND65_09170, partial [Candidatus Binatia bacterium]|nr:hypothetical protein [Candidatus Binatia bacterium]